MTTACVCTAQLKTALEWVAKACDGEASRYVFDSVLVEIGAREITITATDGRRLHNATLPATTTGLPAAALVAVKELQKFRVGPLSSQTRPTEVSITPCNHAGDIGWRIANAKCDLTGASTAGRFPNWRQVVPNNGAPAVLVGEAAEIAKLFDPPGRANRVTVNPSGVFAMPNVAASYPKLTVEAAGIETLLDRDFGRDALAGWGPKEPVTLELRDDTPCVFRSAPQRVVQLLAIVMPIDGGRR